MTDGLILFQSRYGAARRYAVWLAEASGFPLYEAGHVEKSLLRQAECVILVGGVYASGVGGIRQLRKNREALTGKRVAVLAVGASPYDPAAAAAVRQHNLTGGLEEAAFFYARGAWDMAKMSFADRTLCSMLQKAVKKKAPSSLEPWERALAEAGDGPADWTDKRYLEPLITWLKQP